jgi:membrane fusion protein (multidrug efflux system)
MKNTFILTFLFATVMLGSCAHKKEEKEEASKYLVTSPLMADTSFTKEFVAGIRSVKNIEIRAQEKGYLEKIFVDEGQFVKAGQVLFQIMPKVYEAELLKAQAEADEAQIELQNAISLAEKNVVSKKEQAMAQAKYDAAKAEVALAKIHLSFAEIRAPFDGMIDRIPKKQGSLIDEGELLTTLSDNHEIFSYFNISEPEYLQYESNVKIRGNNEVALLMANGERFNYLGKIEVIESEFNNETGNIAFRARFPNPENLLRNGETGKVLMTFPLKDALIIPQKATYEIQDKKYVFVVGSDNTLSSRLITIKGTLPDLYILESGVKADEKILLEGVQKVKENEKISYEYEEPEKVISNLRLKAE